MVVPTNVRLPETVDQSLRTYARSTGVSRSSVIVRALSEWLRSQAHPRIRFVSTPTGERRAALVNGPDIWTVAESWLAHDLHERNTEAVADATGLDPTDVEAALRYWADYRTEIDDLLDRIHTAQDQALAAWERRQSLASLP